MKIRTIAEIRKEFDKPKHAAAIKNAQQSCEVEVVRQSGMVKFYNAEIERFDQRVKDEQAKLKALDAEDLTGANLIEAQIKSAEKNKTWAVDRLKEAEVSLKEHRAALEVLTKGLSDEIAGIKKAKDDELKAVIKRKQTKKKEAVEKPDPEAEANESKDASADSLPAPEKE